MHDDPNAMDGRDPEPEVERPRRRRVHRAKRIVVNLTSLIDVTFLLLIYFMVATDFKTREQVFRMDLPERRSASGGGGDPFKLDEQPLRIAVSSIGTDARRCTIRVEGPYPQPDSFEALFEFLREKRMSGAASGGGLFAADHPIIIQPTATTSWEHAMEAFNAAARARYTNINFAKPA